MFYVRFNEFWISSIQNIHNFPLWQLRFSGLITQRAVVVPYRRFGTSYWPPSSGVKIPESFSNSWPLKKGPLGCSETSVRNYYYPLRNDPEGNIFHLFRGGSPEPRNFSISPESTSSYQSSTCGGEVMGKFSPAYGTKTYGGVEVELHAWLSAVLGAGKWSDSRLGRFIHQVSSPWNSPGRPRGGTEV